MRSSVTNSDGKSPGWMALTLIGISLVANSVARSFVNWLTAAFAGEYPIYDTIRSHD